MHERSTPRRLTSKEIQQARVFVRSLDQDALNRLWCALGLGFPRYAGPMTWAARGLVAAEMRRRREARA